MNLERGISAAKEKRDVWTPVTPKKLVMPRPDQPPVQMQQNQKGGENWKDLLGFYKDVLQDESSGLSPSWNAESHAGVNQGDPTFQEHQNNGLTGVIGQHTKVGVAFAETANTVLPRSSGSARLVGMNHWNRGIQNARNVGSYLLNVGEADVVPPQKVHSLGELLGMRSTLDAPIKNPSSISQHSQIERNWTNCITDSMISPLQNNILYTNQDIGGYNLQQMPSSRISVAYRPSYNLGVPPRSEAAESLSIDKSSHLVPVTPIQKKLLIHNQISQIPHLSIDEISTQEESNKQNLMLPQQAEIGEREHNDFVSDTLSTASPNITTTKEKQKLVGKNDGESYLNKTPPPKAPKRRKHRPKVVEEGKPRRTPKAAAKENKNPRGNSPTKRKYVRKKGIKTSTNQPAGAENEVEVINSKFQGKTCKRALNFELESEGKKIKCNEVDNQADKNQGANASIGLNLDILNTELNRKATCMMEAVHQNLCREQRQTEYIPFVEKVPPQETQQRAAKVPPTPSKDHTLNIIARSLKMRNTNLGQYGVQRNYGQLKHYTGESLPQLVILANTSQQDLDRLKQPRHQTTPQQEPARAYSHTMMAPPLMVSQMFSHEVSEADHCEKTSTRPWLNGAVSSRNNIKYTESKTNWFATDNISAEEFPEQSGSPKNKSLQTQVYKLQMIGGSPHSGSEEMSTLKCPTYETKVAHHWCMNYVDSGLEFQKQMADTKSHRLLETQANSSVTTIANSLLSASHRDPKVIKRDEIKDAPARMSAKRQYTRRTPSKMSSTDKVLKQDTRNLQGCGHDSKTISGSQGYKRNIYSIDDITYHMKNLQISNNGNGNVEGDHNALVPYTGDGAVVPYEVFEPVKKRRPRPKVDLDPETNRLWNLLMGGDEGNESAETIDKNKEKWWEEERRVFRGRVDSFIARMHLVQGDRRFSKWKGSVVDSVIGVFLTQNVSDHLSSSAFMSLAAKFPIKSTSVSGTSSQKAGKTSAEYVVLVRHPDGTTCHQQMTREIVYNNTSVKSSKLSEYGEEHVTSGTSSVNDHARRTKEGMVSSQSSSESESFLASEDIRSSSGSNSEVEDQVTGCNFRENQDPSYLFKEDGGITAVKNNQIQGIGSSFPFNKPSNDHQQYENLASRQYPGATRSINTCSYPLITNSQQHQRPTPTSKSPWQSMLMDTGNREIDVFAFLEKECSSSLTSTLCDTTSPTVTEDLHDKAGQNMESSTMEQQTGSSKLQLPTAYNEVLTKHHEKKINLPTESESGDNQYIISNKHREMQEIFQKESNFLTDPVKSAEVPGQNPTDNQKPSESITLQPTEMKTVHASNEQSSKSSMTSSARKQKADTEKVKSFDWDTLRQQVLKGGTRGRSRETLDYLDYEALRLADVQEISNCIKERGMNNMLAARMKDFLNRLVQDHGSIDLEWLRDAQPDRVKDYLLSIRGLGLKSVECVRLLTLHHLAFPVDTNVGRIAIRLGWVPLQPLPESLQLHLLEMYPVLETIQKYLWPRLCMLDQETLYELHYQLITFGKVFCTKRQPNCNGCPMRGECRHFASAFASSRLALPGPEERRVVCSGIPTNPSKNCGVVSRPMPLPSPSDNFPGVTRNCEPIIEEPTTPESSIEVTERDIEDAFYEDPDEIPEIKLNIEEFTTNLQSIIQENKELQEGDMSKAIISLSPHMASIPMPKLKHVSRLRTEHQVYELPDSHPLLVGMDRREPDDPSPYLLALWTPGETADSIQPPEGKCNFSEGGLCDKRTCFPCNSTREAQTQSVRGTILIPCRTAMRGSFPLNGTYFQVNEVFADHETSTNPIHVPRSLIWDLPRRTVFFGTSVTTIFKGMSTEDIQYCFWKGFVCVRGFEQKTRAPRPLKARLHLPASKIPKQND